MPFPIGDIVEQVKIVTPITKCEEVYRYFNEIPSIEGIIVCSKNKPVGLVMKTHFYQALSTKYGFNLFMNRSINLVMDKFPLIVDYSLPITEVSSLAMNRSVKHLYDYVIVTKQGSIAGIVSIKNLLVKLTEVQVRIARNSNPLTGLPGNFVIEETLQNLLLSRSQFSVFYIDIDSFKTFNDTHGFRDGDELIRETANIIVENIKTPSKDSSFVGHIGGDDFIAVIPNYEYETICQSIISRFGYSIRQFYSKEELHKGYVEAISRKGRLEKINLASLSIAVVSNKVRTFESVKQLSKAAAKVKKCCKAVKKNIFLTLEDCNEIDMAN
jgi:diguanylate cyclase (GGDEF)-like protein